MFKTKFFKSERDNITSLLRNKFTNEITNSAVFNDYNKSIIIYNIEEIVGITIFRYDNSEKSGIIID